MCLGPIQLTANGAVTTAACGHCMACARRRTLSWTLRLLLELSEHTLSDFVTLTYSPERCVTVLDYRDIELFMKRLRRSTPARVRFFCCGEYGGKTGRPHWHVLLYGHRLPERGLSHIEQWPFGHVFSGEIERNSAMYVCRYTLKSADKSGLPQIVRMSRRPGIGMNAIRRLGSTLAKTIPDMPYVPPVLSYSGKSYWLDRHAYKAMVDAYLNAGGVLDEYAAPWENNWLDSAVKAQPIDHIARQWLKASHGKTSQTQ